VATLLVTHSSGGVTIHGFADCWDIVAKLMMAENTSTAMALAS
jgi:hypothetical protein